MSPFVPSRLPARARTKTALRCPARLLAELRSAWPLLLAPLLTACPMYGSTDCRDDRRACSPDLTCDLRTGLCVLLDRSGAGPACDAPQDCPTEMTCGKDGRCHRGSCGLHDCVEGYRCQVVDGGHSCTVAD